MIERIPLTTEQSTRGFTLLEVLIAFVILGVGLLGAAALMISTSNANIQAFEYTQADMLLSSLEERMRANVLGTNLNTQYVFSTSSPPPSSSPCANYAPDSYDPSSSSQQCTPENRARADVLAWTQQFADSLLSGTVTYTIVACPDDNTCRQLSPNLAGYDITLTWGTGSNTNTMSRRVIL